MRRPAALLTYILIGAYLLLIGGALLAGGRGKCWTILPIPTSS